MYVCVSTQSFVCVCVCLCVCVCVCVCHVHGFCFDSYDVGVAGLHRILGNVHRLTEADVVICVAGMDGALPSVVGGLVDAPVIAVPTSVGWVGPSVIGVAV